MILGSPRNILFLRRNSFTLYSQKARQQLNIELSKEIVQNEEVKDLEKLKKQIGDLISTNKLSPKKLIIVLAEENCFTHILKEGTDDQEKPQIGTFLEKIPFEPGLIVKKTFIIAEKKVIIAANKSLYEAISGTFRNFGWETIAVVPVLVLTGTDFQPENQPNTKSLSADEIKFILENNKILKESNFLSEDDTEAKSSQPSSKTNTFPRLLILVIAIVTIIFVVLGIRQFTSGRILNDKETIRLSSTEQTPIQTPELNSTSTAETKNYLPKEDLEILILNGTREAGLAKTLKEKLILTGYKNINTGNVTSPDESATVVLFSDSVSLQDKDLIINELNTTFASVTNPQDKPENSDILITTGELK